MDIPNELLEAIASNNINESQLHNEVYNENEGLAILEEILFNDQDKTYAALDYGSTTKVRKALDEIEFGKFCVLNPEKIH